MTYESIVRNWIRGEAFTALDELLKKHSIRHPDITSGKVDIDKTYNWEVYIDVLLDEGWKTYTVFGTVNDLTGVEVVGIRKGRRLIWMFDDLAREELDITSDELTAH